MLKRKLDRQRRANNPLHFTADGRVIPGPKKWHYSKRYIRTRSKLREMERKHAETRKQLHGRDSNQVLQMARSVNPQLPRSQLLQSVPVILSIFALIILGIFVKTRYHGQLANVYGYILRMTSQSDTLLIWLEMFHFSQLRILF